MPSDRSCATRSVTSARTRAARAAPSRMRAVIDASVPEVTLAREHHGDAVLVGGGHQLTVSHRAPGLDHGHAARRGQDVEPVAEREEGVAGGGSPPAPFP